MFLMAVLTAVFLGILQKKAIMSLSRLSISMLYLPLAAYMIQYGLDYGAERELDWLQGWYGMLHVCTYFLLFYWGLVNRRLPGLKLICAGMLLNFLVIAANHGLMPVDPGVLPQAFKAFLAAGLSGTHSLISSETRMTFLADIIYLPWPFNELDSVGDLLLALGAFFFVYGGMSEKAGKGTGDSCQ